MSQGSKFIGKLFNKEKKEEKIMHALNRAGHKKAESDAEKLPVPSLTSSSISSDEEVYHDNAAGARNVKSSNSHGNSASEASESRKSDYSKDRISSSKGEIVSHPPEVQRKPLDHTYGGDYANGKNPTEVSTYNSKPKDEKGLIDNSYPRYDNSADIAKGQGQFFDPNDTQGRTYKTGLPIDQNESTNKDHVPIGVQAAAASSGLPGGVSKGEYGEDTEATHAQLQQKNLKTKPTAYAEEEKARKQAEKVETDAYNAGRRKGLNDAKKGEGYTQENHGSSLSKSVDPKSEHSKNRSAFNEGGLTGATAEAKYGRDQSALKSSQDQYSDETSSQESPNNSEKDGSSKYVGEGVGDTTGVGAGFAANRQSDKKTLDPAGGQHPSTGQQGNHFTTPISAAADLTRRKSRSKSSDYSLEIKRLDQSIEQTQKEIEALGGASGGNSSTTGQPLQLNTVAQKSPEIDGAAYSAGHSGGTNTQPLEAKSDRSGVKLNDTGDTSKHSRDSSYLDSTKAAIASAGIAAASGFGYEGYKDFYVDENQVSEEPSKGDYVDQSEINRSTLVATEKPALKQNDDGKTKPSATASSMQHPGSTATSGAAALAKDKDSKRFSASHDSEKIPDKSKSGSGNLSSATGASQMGSEKNSKIDSLVEEAASGYDDVRKEPRHKTKGGVLQDDEQKNKTVADELDPTKDKSSEAETSGVDNTKLEADIAAYNKQHGFTQGKSLVEAAEEQYPEIKKQPAHQKNEEDERESMNDPAKKSDRESSEARDSATDRLKNDTQVKKSPFATGSSNARSDKEKDPIDPLTKGSTVSRIDSTSVDAAQSGGSVRKGSHAPPVAHAAMGKSREESMEIENAAFAAGAGRGSTPGRASRSQPVIEAALGKSRQESMEIEQAAQLAGATGVSSYSHPVTGAATGKPTDESKEIEEAAYQAGHSRGSSLSQPRGMGSGAAVSSRGEHSGTATSPKKSGQQEQDRPLIEVIGIPEREDAQKVAQQTTRELLNRGENLSGSKIVVDANKQEVYKTKGGESISNVQNPAGHGQPDASFNDSQKEIDGSGNHAGHERVKHTLEHQAEKGNLGNVSGSPDHSQLQKLNSSSPRGSLTDPNSSEIRKHSFSHRNELPGKDVSYTEVTVLGEPDTDRAQVLAQDAIASLKGRKDILAAHQLSVDAYTGSICDQDGRFVAQLCQRRLSQVGLGQKRRSSGGLVSLGFTNSTHGSASNSDSKTFPIAHEKVSSSMSHTSQGPFLNQYNLSSAQGAH